MNFIIILQAFFAFAYFVNCAKIPKDYIVNTQSYEFKYFDLENDVKCISFSIQLGYKFDIKLSNTKSDDDFAVEFNLASHGNQKSSLKVFPEGYISPPVDTVDILHQLYMHTFWLSWDDNKYELGTKGTNTSILFWRDKDYHKINFFGIRSPTSDSPFHLEEPVCSFNVIRY